MSKSKIYVAPSETCEAEDIAFNLGGYWNTDLQDLIDEIKDDGPFDGETIVIYEITVKPVKTVKFKMEIDEVSS